MNHKYSTWAIFIVLGISTFMLVIGLDGSGTKDAIPKYFSPDRLVPSQLIDDGENLTFNGSKICTESNGFCGNAKGNGTVIRVLNGSVGDGTYYEWLI